jgi:hypothetical protein
MRFRAELTRRLGRPRAARPEKENTEKENTEKENMSRADHHGPFGKIVDPERAGSVRSVPRTRLAAD